MNAQLSPDFGDPKVRALQKARGEQVSDLADRHRAAIHARTFSSDDPMALGAG